MSKKIISILLSTIFILALVSCAKPDEGNQSLPPVSTVGLPKNEDVTVNYETDGFVVNVYQTYSEIVQYKGTSTEVTVPDAFMGIPVKSIAEYAFFGNETLTKITLPDSVIVIGKSAFQDCVKLTDALLGSKVELISQGAFRDSALERINLPDTVAEIERYAFYRTSLTEIKLPSSLSSIPKYAFYGCDKLTKIEFGVRVQKLGEYAFSACSSLKTVIIPDRIDMINDYCFSECPSLEKIFIPKNTSLGDNPFHGCEKLTVYSPSGSKAKTAAGKYGYSFSECASADQVP